MALHTCWDDEERFDGTLDADRCAGCREAKAHPCDFCGYGVAFPTHNPLSHYDSDDPAMPADENDLPDSWFDTPHSSTTGSE